ncbi:amidase [Desulfoluna spongiiphila]|uniref:amidase n=1 Tax=Desulfoluna spongiiphila TaxID=419481 RepID=UPI0012596449|nr:amidase family protein [Desulfoluna spongiiphila]VVS91523.1 amidase signature (as) superfamily [Desulfoluna spongiiphila]
MLNEYTRFDALGLAELVRKGDVHPRELLESAISRTEQMNPDLNAIIYTFFDRARSMASGPLPEGPFTGVPFLLKDLMDSYAGEPLCKGSRGIRAVPEENSELVNRFVSAGVVPFGKTNTPEFGLTITTEPKSSGPAHNPWGRGISTGGSSGGSAAAVAAGIVPMASANDGGGSIRFPSACCGVFGLKPSRGLNPMGPESGEGWDGAVAGHVITRSVRDSAAMLDITAGPEVGAPYRVSRGHGTYLDACGTDPAPLRIAFSSRPFTDATLNPEAVRGLEATVKKLEELGHQVEEADPEIDTDALWRDFFVVVCAHVAAEASLTKKEFGKDAFAALEPSTLNMAMIGRSLTACDLVMAKKGWHAVQLSMGRFLTRYDLLLTPTLIAPPDPHGVLPPTRFEDILLKMGSPVATGRLLMKMGLVKHFAGPTLSRMAFTVLGNISGLPSVSMPLHWTDAGLPLGMLFTGRMCDERTLFRLASQIERAFPWADRYRKLD